MLTKNQILVLFIVLNALNFSHAASIQFGDLLISEVMANPSSVSDVNGEWFEIFNASANTIDLNGITISDDGSNAHQINNASGLLILPGAYLVLGRNGDIVNNGGYTAQYVYNNFSLNNTLDQIVLSNNGNEITRLDYTGLPFGSAGISAELINQLLAPKESDYQLTQSTQYGLGDFGTPGSRGSLPLINTSSVPVPSAIWLFASAVFILTNKFKLTHQQLQPIRKYSLC
ncbi:MAG: lamin tail domain-containing protein [Gammaproteobacteria bacterium]|nr:lamin tail domain-containing protein [Gammaproteobacteria bacterium]